MIDGDEALVAALALELDTREVPLTFVLRPLVALQLAGLLQLALRHPTISDAHQLVAMTFIDHVRTYFADAPATLELLRRGDGPT